MLEYPLWKKLLIAAICLLGLYLALPSLMPNIKQHEAWYTPQKSVVLGLDLQGGSYLLLEVDSNAYFKEQYEQLLEAARTSLRKAGVGYKNLSVAEKGIRFTMRDVAQGEAAKKTLAEVDNRYQWQLDGDEASLSVSDLTHKEMLRQVVEQSIEIVRRRVDETGTREPIIARQGESRILVQVPGLSDPSHLKNLLGRTAKLSFHLVNEGYTPTSARPADIPQGSMVLPYHSERTGQAGYLAVERASALTGDRLVDANASFERGNPVVSFRFDSLGARIFGELTTQYVHKRFAVVLDGNIITAPVINEPILGGSGIISGQFDVKSANDLALLLRAGALPAPLTIVEERSVGPSLGADSVAAGEKASLLAIALTFTFMMLRYRLFGMFASVALLMNLLLLLAGMSLLQATLTLPGIAGIALTMGMAVDANVLIYERIKEELRNGRTVISAVQAGFDRAFSTIWDSNLTTLLAAGLLYYFGSGPIKGFSVTLSLGIVTSMFTAISVTKWMVASYVLKKRPKTLAL